MKTLHENILEIVDLRMTFGGLVAVDNVRFSLKRG